MADSLSNTVTMDMGVPARSDVGDEMGVNGGAIILPVHGWLYTGACLGNRNSIGTAAGSIAVCLPDL